MRTPRRLWRLSTQPVTCSLEWPPFSDTEPITPKSLTITFSSRFPPALLVSFLRHSYKTTQLIEKNGGSVCESNTPATSWMPPAGFEDRDDHRTACASLDFANFLLTNS